MSQMRYRAHNFHVFYIFSITFRKSRVHNFETQTLQSGGHQVLHELKSLSTMVDSSGAQVKISQESSTIMND